MGRPFAIYMCHESAPCAHTAAVCFQSQQPAGVTVLVVESVKHEVAEAVDDGLALILLHILCHMGMSAHHGIGTHQFVFFADWTDLSGVVGMAGTTATPVGKPFQMTRPTC